MRVSVRAATNISRQTSSETILSSLASCENASGPPSLSSPSLSSLSLSFPPLPALIYVRKQGDGTSDTSKQGDVSEVLMITCCTVHRATYPRSVWCIVWALYRGAYRVITVYITTSFVDHVWTGNHENPKPETRNPKPETRNPEPETLNHVYVTLNHKPMAHQTFSVHLTRD